MNALNPIPCVQDTPRNMRFSINFFTSIGLGGLTDDMREHLKVSCRAATAATAAAAAAAALPLHC
jgi:pre-mRNA-splicing factor CWC22